MAATAEEVTIDLAESDAVAEKSAGKTPDGETLSPDVIVEEKSESKKDAQKVINPEEGIEKLKKQLKDEQEARAAAEARAQEAAKSEAEARGRVQTTELDLVKNAITTVTQANDALEARYADAMAAQDWTSAAKLQRQMSDNSAKLAQLEAGKAQLEKQPKPSPRAPVDPVEAFCAHLSAPSAAWVRAHPEFARDPHKNRQMIAAHELAIARGHQADTGPYFRYIERTLDLDAPRSETTHGSANGAHGAESDVISDPSASVSTGGRQAAPAAAPVSRTASGPSGSRSNVVRLTPDEIEMAHASFPDSKTPLEDYARQKLALKKEGKLS